MSYYLPGKHTIIIANTQQLIRYRPLQAKDYTKIKVGFLLIIQHLFQVMFQMNDIIIKQPFQAMRLLSSRITMSH